MEKCTLESIYDLIIDYYVRGYAMSIGDHDSNPRDNELNKLDLYLRADTSYLDWDNIPDSSSRTLWDNTLTIPRYLT